MKILVTGGAGYVGSHACKALAQAGHEPIVYDNLSRGHRSLVKWGTFERGDILDRSRLEETLVRHKPDGVLHFAAFAYVGESVENPALYYRNNVVGSHCLLEAMRQCGPNLLVFSSTCATYGPPIRLPIDEDHPQKPVNPYGASKLVVEGMLRDYGKAYGLRWAALRYFNAAGADPDGEIGEMHDPETHAIPLAILAALGRIPSFQVYGTDYPTRDGSAVRDYIHVADLAAAHVAALDYLARGGDPLALNLGTGHATSVLEIIRAVERVTGMSVPTTQCARRPGDPSALVADGSRARSILGWTPEYRAVEMIVASAWRWHRSRCESAPNTCSQQREG
jgi:UDP-arabinose 4-epimerase